MGESLWTTLERTRTLPVVVLDDVSAAVPIAESLVAGGVPVIEITLRTPAALDCIHDISAALPGIHVGAGTVLSADQVDEAVDAGATFIVSPGLSEEVLTRADERGVTAIPGVATASEIQRALALGQKRLKFFPAASSGGAEAVKAFASPFQAATFIPTGGITPETAPNYLELPNVLAVGGSWIVDRKAVSSREFHRIESAAAAAISSATGVTP